jgi:4'-phosphopantetheinyl transferase
VGQGRVIDLWFCHLAGSGDRNYDQIYRHILSEDEHQRAARFHFDDDRRFFVFCRGMLRNILGQRLNQPPESLRFALGVKGKPSLPDSGITFNVSHAGEMFACAVSEGAELGVDVERVHPIEDMFQMAKHFFAPEETARLASIAPAEQTHSFFECWTRKEAVIKATGEGVSRALDSFEVGFGPGAAAELLRLDENRRPGWTMRSFEPRRDYVAALASVEGWDEVRVHEWG